MLLIFNKYVRYKNNTICVVSKKKKNVFVFAYSTKKYFYRNLVCYNASQNLSIQCFNKDGFSVKEDKMNVFSFLESNPMYYNKQVVKLIC